MTPRRWPAWRRARRLRDLGFDLDTVRRILDGKVTLTDVVTLHAEALDAQIRILRLRRAVMRAVAKRRSTLEEIELMKLAKLSEEERNRILTDFYEEIFGGLDQRVRPMAEAHSAIRRAGEEVMPEWAKGIERLVAEHAGAAPAAGVDPASPEAGPSSTASSTPCGARRPIPPISGRRGPNASRWAPTPGSSVTGSCSGSSTAGWPLGWARSASTVHSAAGVMAGKGG